MNNNKHKNMMSILTVCTVLMGISYSAQAQTKPPVKPKNTAVPYKPAPTATPKPKVESHFTGEGVSSGASSSNTVKLSRLEKARTDLETELTEINNLQKSSNDPCEQDELKWRKADAEFLKKNADQIQEIIGRVRKGLKAQLSLIRGFQSGASEGDEMEDYTNSEGVADKSVMIEFRVIGESNKAEIKRIPVKELMKYIAQYEADAKTLSETALSDKYKNAEFFGMTLADATKAYKERLNSVFQRSFREEQSRTLGIGSGKDMFRVTTTTTLGWDPTHNTKVGSQLGNNKNADKMNLSIVQNFGEALDQAAEDKYWEILRTQQLTIDGIPVDGYLRRIYFDSMRSPECQKKKSYTFRSNATPGPYSSYDQKDTCTKHGIEILTASMTKTHNYGGSAPVGTVFDLTEKMRQEADTKDTASSSNGYYSMVSSLGMGSCDDVSFRISYRCGCERTPREVNLTYKMNRAISFGCN